jgi:hypothetical protein
LFVVKRYRLVALVNVQVIVFKLRQPKYKIVALYLNLVEQLLTAVVSILDRDEHSLCNRLLSNLSVA